MKRFFLGWETSLVESAAEWLWTRREEIASLCVVVPTAQAGRRLREAVLQRATNEQSAILGLRTVTPAYFIKIDHADMAEESIELLAWMEVMESIQDWSPYHAAFPHPLDEGEGKGWSRPIAQSLMELRYHLQENGSLIGDAAKRMGQHSDAARWTALAMLEQQVEKVLRSWSLRSRSDLLQQQFHSQQPAVLPQDCKSLVLVGITETSPFVAELWRRVPQSSVLIAAPEEEAENFVELGFPSLSWCERSQGFPGRDGTTGSLQVTADYRQLAEQAVKCVAARGASSDQVMLATCDPSLGQPLTSAFERAGWQVFDPATSHSALDWRVWLRHWQRWLSKPSLAIAAEMAGFRETTCLTGGGDDRWLQSLGVLRDQCLVDTLEDVERLSSASKLPRVVSEELAQQLMAALRQLTRWRTEFFRKGFCATMQQLLELWQTESLIEIDDATWLTAVLTKWQPWEQRMTYDAAFWLQLCCDRLPAGSLEMPETRALDVEGWLEIPFHRAEHLVICGMDDQCIPSRFGGEPWLNASNRGMLGLLTDARREARDAYLFHTVLQAYHGHGAIDILLSKTDTQGKILLPSRLLLRASGPELAERVALLFAEVSPVDSQLHWHRDWHWQPRTAPVTREKEGILRLSVTALRDYLSCPYRFYLKHGLHMSQRDGDRGEWNHRDFGNLMHELLEAWGKDDSMRDMETSSELTDCWNDLLSDLIAVRYGTKVNLALQIQSTALRQRLAWLAEAQARQRAQGWKVWKVETPFLLEMPLIQLSGKIDRIDYNEVSDSYMMWDYKTGKVEEQVRKSHLKGMTAKTMFPAHLAHDDRFLVPGDKGKMQYWTNLQLPLYAAAGLTPHPPGVGYIAVGDSSDDVAFRPWDGFDASIVESARSCAMWLIEKIAREEFWPPNEKAEFDDFTVLASGANLEQMTQSPWSLQA
jgi:ATP-dependent helicase/nuclease subunit B